ncbi:MAG: hypothetical protein EXR77_10660 [Myxococcales bacterium]|nr:hypothetical protein [Myxococcales bacterium]
MRYSVLLGLSLVTVLSAFSAEAQEAPANSEPAASAPDGSRFRFGINATTGRETVADSAATVSGSMYGLDVRLGWQISNLIAIYAQPHLSLGSLSGSVGGAAVSGLTGTLTATLMAEATIVDRLFGAAGVGYGILNNPSGFTFEVRAGFYPLMGRPGTGPRRKGLMVGVDYRAVSTAVATGVLIMGCIGYEAY